MSYNARTHQPPFGIRRDLRTMTGPAMVAYVLITILTLLAKTLGYAFALLAEVAERVAVAGDTARDAAHQADPNDDVTAADFHGARFAGGTR
jgi:hypothetical protein